MFSALSHSPLVFRTGNPHAVQLKPAAASVSMTFTFSKLNRKATTQGRSEMASGREAS